MGWLHMRPSKPVQTLKTNLSTNMLIKLLKMVLLDFYVKVVLKKFIASLHFCMSCILLLNGQSNVLVTCSKQHLFVFIKKYLFVFSNYGRQDANLNLSLIDVANLILQIRKVQLNTKKKKRKHSSSNSKDKILNLSLIDVANLRLESRKVQLNAKKKKRKHSSS
jgi:hypothetical protein